MRLYKMELFKLFQNKIFKIGMLATTGLLFLYFWFAEVGGEISTAPDSGRLRVMSRENRSRPLISSL